MTFSISKKGILLVSLLAASQITYFLLLAFLQEKSAANARWTIHTKEVMQQAQAALTGILDAESHARNFIYTQKQSFADDYQASARNISNALDRLEQLVADNSIQHEKAVLLQADAQSHLARISEIIDLYRAGDKTAVAVKVRDALVKNPTEKIRKGVSELLEEERSLDQQRMDAFQHSLGQWSDLLVGGTIVSLIMTCCLVFFFIRGVVGRLAVLTDNAARFSQGRELNPPVLGNDEVAALDRAFHDTASKLTDATNQLRQSTEEYRALYNFAPCGYMSLDDEGIVQSMNETALKWLGYTHAEIVGKTHASTIITPHRRISFPERFDRIKRQGVVLNVETEFLRKDGSVMPVLYNSFTIRDAAGKFVCARTSFFDISDRKKAEEEIRTLNDELEKRVRDRTAELFEANRDLAQKNIENETFVYSVSHDLRSPLVNLQGFSKELSLTNQELRNLISSDGVPVPVRDKALGLLDGDISEATRFILAGVSRLGRIIDALLRLSRVGRIEYQWRLIDLNPLLRSIVEALNATIAEKKAIVVVGELPAVRGDGLALEQLFANLVVNALNYLDPKRPGRIEIQLAENQTSQEGFLVYSIRDNGLGIVTAHQAKVFQAFQRCHPEVAPGEGMGLAIVRRIVERHRGKIWLESTPGVGTTFFVALPSESPTAMD